MNMKNTVLKLFALAALVGTFCAASVPPAAAGKYGMAGCGLGSVMFEGSTDTTSQVLAATTNDISGYTKLSAMSSGTSNCTMDGVALIEKEQELFAEVNLDDLARDMARGEGEYLTAYAAVLGCDAGSYNAFAVTTQANYEKIFSGEEATASDILGATKNVLRNDASLAQSCSRL